jgi:hypothetical protein
MSSTVEITWYNIWVSVFYHSFTTCSFILNSIYLFFKSWSSSWDCDSGRPSGRTGFGSGRRSGGGRLGEHETGGRNTLVLWIRVRYPGVKSGPVWYGSGGKGCRDVSPGVWSVPDISTMFIYFLPAYRAFNRCNIKIERTQRAIKTDEHFRTLLTPEVLSAYLFGIFNKPWAG